MASFPVIDLFAGPGGLSEGFSAYRGSAAFRIAVSFEMDSWAHRTLTLRAFFRQFRGGRIPDAYYAYARGEIPIEAVAAAHPERWEQATAEARQVVLGQTPHEEVRAAIDDLVGSESRGGTAVVIGGPPCQAYSLVGRSRMRPGNLVEFEADHRHFLYKEYLRILADHAPAVFVLENVKGLLSSTHGGRGMFERIVDDLRSPGKALGDSQLRFGDVTYRLVALGSEPQTDLLGDVRFVPADFVLRSETLGLPQARHRVIILGIRSDLPQVSVPPLPRTDDPLATVERTIYDLPQLRSGLSHSDDSPADWRSLVSRLAQGLSRSIPEMRHEFRETAAVVRGGDLDRGAGFVPWESDGPDYQRDWYRDDRLGGVLNHETRGHMPEDLARYLYAATFAERFARSPALRDFPSELLPMHRNVGRAIESGLFSDRFRVQVRGRPSTTITSHISKDGHYFIHPDPTQCRSLTVREAARLQTFPDNYRFEGPRTSQYVQVGNAVPPLLAVQIAGVVGRVLAASRDGAPVR